MLLDYIQKGGWVMYPILLASVIALAVFIERMVYLNKVKRNAKAINEQMRIKLRGLRVDEAIGVCENNPGPASNIINAGLQVYDKSRDLIEKAMEDASVYEIPKLNKHLPILATIVNISTLLGLLGTVLGMISSSTVLSTEGMANPGKLIGGIAQALITTAAGLIVAIPSLIGYNYLTSKIDSIISDIEIGTTELISLLKKQSDERLESLSRTDSLRRW